MANGYDIGDPQGTESLTVKELKLQGMYFCAIRNVPGRHPIFAIGVK
jgi:hypothetical protein